MGAAYAASKVLIKCCINEEFEKASLWEKLQHILESMNLPEAYGDWDTNNELDVDGHFQKWWMVLVEMYLMVLLQLVSNLTLLVPFFITGTNT